MSPKAAIIHNEMAPDRYAAMGEQKAVEGVLTSVRAVNRALTKLKYDVSLVPLSPPLEAVEETLRGIATDVVFNLFEGFGGQPETEAAVAGMLARLGMAYTGCSSATLLLALDKARAKKLMLDHGLPTPRYQELTPQTVSGFNLTYPCIVKPAAEDASHGLAPESVVWEAAGLKTQVARINEHYGGRTLVEEYVDGREFNATVLGNEDLRVLPVTEIVYTLPEGMPRILTFEAKWEPGSLYFKSSVPVCPAQIDGEVREVIARTAVAVFKLLGCTGYARVDFRMAAGGTPQIIEVNPNPDLSPDYGAALQARRAGIPYYRLVESIVDLALERRTIETRS